MSVDSHGTPPPREAPPGNEPLVSIVTPAHDAARFLRETIASVRAQTDPRWELILVDDASRDATAEIAGELAREDPRIRIVRFPSNRGAAAARNAGMDAARGRYVAFLDCDDLWLPEKIEVQLQFMERTGAEFTFADYRMIDESGHVIGRPILAPPAVDYRKLLRNTIIGCLTVMIRRDVLGSARMPDLRRHEDLVLWFTLLKRGIVARGIHRDLARYRIVRGSRSRDKIATARNMWKVYREVEKLSLPHALWCFVQYAWHAQRKNRT
jgi:teichuronic acid biosynthesis glycosyltransferase TuaG